MLNVVFAVHSFSSLKSGHSDDREDLSRHFPTKREKNLFESQSVILKMFIKMDLIMVARYPALTQFTVQQLFNIYGVI